MPCKVPVLCCTRKSTRSYMKSRSWRRRNTRDKRSAQTAESRAQRDSLGCDVAGREDELREQRRRLTELQDQRGALEVDLAQKNMTVQNLRDRIRQKYQLNLNNIRSECITITIADEGPTLVTLLTPEEIAASGAATD